MEDQPAPTERSQEYGSRIIEAMVTNQTFRDIYRTDTMDVDQRLKITSLTFLFTDLKGSTELYDRVGDLVAFDLVRSHFRVLQEIVALEGGAIVKTIGDAVMATFPTPDRAVAAALRMREAMRSLNEEGGHEDDARPLTAGGGQGASPVDGVASCGWRRPGSPMTTFA